MDRRILIAAALGAALVLTAAGCAEPKIEFREVVRLDDALSEADVATLERIAGRLRGGRLPEMCPHFLPAPAWAPDRPASVATLAREELARLREVSRLAPLSESLARDARLAHVLKKERLTLDQYAALVLAVGTASQRARMDGTRDLDAYVRVGRRRMKELAGREDAFATLDPQGQIDALGQATWLTRVDRAERLAKIPPENVTLAAAARPRLEKILPRQFLVSPFAGIGVPLLDAGVPFREDPTAGFDAELFWTRADERAVIGGKAVAADPESAYR